MNARRWLVVVLTLGCIAAAWAGHELPVYPSYYPHQIEIATATPEEATEQLRTGKMHAFVGNNLQFTELPPTVTSVQSLGSLIVAELNPQSPSAGKQAEGCEVSGALLRALAQGQAKVIVHPYPVTPYHGDYLYHADIAEAAKARFLVSGETRAPETLKVKAESLLTQSLVPPHWLAKDQEWDVVLRETDVGALTAAATVMTNAWLGPRWTRSGWFHAYRLLGDAIVDPAARQQVESTRQRLQHAKYDSQVARINLERDLVKALTADCRIQVLGYTVRENYFNWDFSAGIENIGYDALEGFSSPMFVRTAKLKDFPWNGWLQLGLGTQPNAAWNPVAGFNDDFGRLLWFALSDPAVVPSPYDANWMLNRFSNVQAAPSQR
jgi:hypothetical protein